MYTQGWYAHYAYYSKSWQDYIVFLCGRDFHQQRLQHLAKKFQQRHYKNILNLAADKVIATDKTKLGSTN